MMHRLGQVRRRRGVYAAVGMLAACGALAGVGAAGAAQQATDVTIGIAPGNKFDPNDPTVVPIATGDTIVWNFDASAGVSHNVKATGGPPEDADWATFVTTFRSSGEVRRTFTQPGTYTFLCQAHTGMSGTIEVTGPAVTPTPTPTPTGTPTTTPTPQPTATPTPTPTPGPSGTTPPMDDHTTTPAPVNIASADSTAPALSALRLKALRRGARVTFKLSEPATVTLRFKKRGTSKVVRTVRLQARPGTRTLSVHSARLKRGRYTVELQARDATGNTSSALRSNLRIRRK
jgi:plastocyanin